MISDRSTIRSNRAARLIAPVLVLFCFAPLARAEDQPEDRSYVVGKWAYQRLSEAHKLVGEEKFSEALEILRGMQGRRSLNAYERALMWQTFGYIHASKEQFADAILNFKKCLELNALPKAAALDTQFNLGQLYIANKQYQEAVAALTDWLGKVEKPTPDAKYMLAVAYVQIKDYQRALPYAQQAIEGAAKPKEVFLQLLLSIYFELKKLPDAAQVLERLIDQFPRKAYWMQLSAVYLELKQENKALAVLELAYLQNFLTQGSELLNLSSLYSYRGVPYKAAKVLEKGIVDGVVNKDTKSLTLLADSWLRARELDRAMPPLSEAARLSPDGDLYVRLAQIHIEREEWQKASEALQSALKKSKVTDPGNAYLLLGIASYRSKRTESARTAFDQALLHNNTKKSAEQWLKVMQQKGKPPEKIFQ